MSNIHVGVLRGGPSDARGVSLATGAAVLEALHNSGYQTRDIFIDTNGVWHVHGTPTSTLRALETVDVVFNTLHGYFGDDGNVQQLLDSLRIPYTGSQAVASAFAANRPLAKSAWTQHGIHTPHGEVVRHSAFSPSTARELFARMPLPCVVTPVFGSASRDAGVATSFDALEKKLHDAFSSEEDVLVEEHIAGTPVTCMVVEDYRGEAQYAFPCVELMKDSDENVGICPGRLGQQEKRIIEKYAKAAHEAVGARHYSQSDMVVSPRGVYVLKVNTQPALSAHTPAAQALDSVGSSVLELVEHLISLALRKK